MKFLLFLGIATSLLTIPVCSAGDISDAPYLNPDLPIDKRVDDLISRLTIEEKATLLNHKGPEITRFHILSDNWNQCLHGVRWSGGPTTLFPIPTGMAATWDTELIHTDADAISDEARAIYNAWHDDPNFKGERNGLIYRSPVINILRNPYWGRNGEAWTEDPFLCGRMAVAFVKGLQGDDPHYLKLAATLTHFAVNNVEKDRTKLSATVSERMLREYWLPHWRDAVVEGRARSVMASYNQINGVHNVYNQELLENILKKDWGFDGFVVSDLGGVHDLDMVVKSVNAGCDFSDKQFMDFIPQAVKSGQISESRLNEALARVLKVRFQLGEFDPAERVPYRKIPMSVVCSPAHHQLSLQTSQESIVLLKNSGLLPLDEAALKHVAVLGPMAENVYEGDPDYVGAPRRKTVGVEQALRASLPGAEIVSEVGAEMTHNVAFDVAGELQKAVAAAKNADVAIVCVGTNGSIEREGHDRTSLGLPGNQEQLVESVLAANPKTIVVLVNAGPLTIPWIKDHVPAMMEGWWSGEAQGPAIADVLLGKVNPSGHLPYTVYASADQVPPQDEYDISKGFTYMYVNGEPLFPFGYGLSYTTFKYSNLALSKAVAKDGDVVVATMDLANTGHRDGVEVVQIYAHEPAGKVVKPRVRLVGFQRLELKAGETTKVTIPLEVARMRYWDETTHAFVAEPGDYEIKAGSNSEDLPLTATFRVAP